jgi:hypothetical protein
MLKVAGECDCPQGPARTLAGFCQSRLRMRTTDDPGDPRRSDDPLTRSETLTDSNATGTQAGDMAGRAGEPVRESEEREAAWRRGEELAR